MHVKFAQDAPRCGVRLSSPSARCCMQSRHLTVLAPASPGSRPRTAPMRSRVWICRRPWQLAKLPNQIGEKSGPKKTLRRAHVHRNVQALREPPIPRSTRSQRPVPLARQRKESIQREPNWPGFAWRARTLSRHIRLPRATRISRQPWRSRDPPWPDPRGPSPDGARCRH